MSNYLNGLPAISEFTNQLTGGQADKLLDPSTSLNPAAARLQTCGLVEGAGSAAESAIEGGVNFIKDQVGGLAGMFGSKSGRSGVKSVPELEDWRIRVSLPVGANLLYQEALNVPMNPLRGTNGVVFPYTPNITTSHKANYSPTKLTHSNYASFSYENSEVDAITIDGDFTVQNRSEGQYLFAAIQFFRSASKMFFGAASSQHRGNPPPILLLNGYGAPYFPAVKCVLTSFSHTMPSDVDYLPVTIGHIQSNSGAVVESQVRLPTTSKISITLQPVYSRKSIHRDFSMSAFASGKLLDKGFI
jgi:hypothetical protein